TTLGSQELPHAEEVKQYCVGRLVRALYTELRERLLADIERQEGKMPPHDAERPTVRELIAGRDNLFADGFAHIDVSHLSAQVLVNLLLRLGRPREALEAARRHLTTADPRQLSCPGVLELCQRAGDYGTFAEVARQQGDAVHYLAGLIQAGK